MNKKERRLAMATAIQSAASSMVVVDDINSGVTVPKSRRFQDNLKSWGQRRRRKNLRHHEGCAERG